MTLNESCFIIKQQSIITEPIKLADHITAIVVEDFVEVVIDDRTNRQTSLLLTLGHGSTVQYLFYNDVMQKKIIANVGADAHLFFVPIITNSQELWCEFNLCKQGAQATIAGFYALKNNQQSRIKTTQNHQAMHTKSNLMVHGMIADAAQAFYEGTIVIEEHAKNSDALQSNKNVLLGTDARVTSIPNLEIKAHEVVCKHASAVGMLDSEQLFYLQSRGISKINAEKVLTDHFLQEPLKLLSSNIKKIVQNIINKII